VVFASIRDGNLVALDAKTGKHLWHFETGANSAASPMSYAVGGRQFVRSLPETRFMHSRWGNRARATPIDAALVRRYDSAATQQETREPVLCESG